MKTCRNDGNPCISINGFLLSMKWINLETKTDDIFTLITKIIRNINNFL